MEEKEEKKATRTYEAKVVCSNCRAINTIIRPKGQPYRATEPTRCKSCDCNLW